METEKGIVEALQAAKKPQRGMAALPNRILVPGKPFVEQYSKMSRQQASVFDNPAKLITHPEPGTHYGWAKDGDPLTLMRVAGQQYEYVQPNELNKDLAPMFITHKGTTGTRVCHGSLVMVKWGEQAHRELFIGPEIEAIAQIARQEESFQANIEDTSQGFAEGTIEKSHETEKG